MRATVVIPGADHGSINDVWADDAPKMVCVGTENQVLDRTAYQHMVWRSLVEFYRDNAAFFDPGESRPEDARAMNTALLSLHDPPSRLTKLSEFVSPADVVLHQASGVQMNFTFTDPYAPNNAIHFGTSMVASWSQRSPNNWAQVNWLPQGRGIDMRPYDRLVIRLMPRENSTSFNNPIGRTSISVHLVDSDDAVSTPQVIGLAPPLGAGDLDGVVTMRNVLQMASLKLSSFSGNNAHHVRGVRFVFQADKGNVAIASVEVREANLDPLEMAAATG